MCICLFHIGYATNDRKYYNIRYKFKINDIDFLASTLNTKNNTQNTNNIDGYIFLDRKMEFSGITAGPLDGLT